MRRVFVLAAMIAFAASVARAEPNPELARRVAAGFRSGGQLQGYRVAVKADDGVVFLRGTVRTSVQKQVAEKLALQTPGVDRVVSQIEVTGAVQPAAHQASQVSAQTSAPAIAAKQTTTGTAGAPMAVNARNVAYVDGGVVDGGVIYEGGPMPTSGGAAPLAYDNAYMPNYAWPSYAAYPNYAAVTYPKQYSASAWPYIGPFYPYPQVPLGWRKVQLEWDDGWWWLNFKDRGHHHRRW